MMYYGDGLFEGGRMVAFEERRGVGNSMAQAMLVRAVAARYLT